MKIIAKVVDLISEELSDAKRYIKLAEQEKENKSLSECFATLAEAEMGHVKALHAEAASLIEDYRAKNGEPPADMLAIYNYEHKKQIARAAKIKQMITEYRNS